METDKIIKRALKLAHRQVASHLYASAVQELVDSENGQKHVIKDRIRSRLVINSLAILSRLEPACSYAKTKRYRYALSAAMIRVGIKHSLGESIHITTIPFTTFHIDGVRFDLYYVPESGIRIGVNNQMTKITAEPMKVAEMIVKAMNTEIPQSMVDEIMKESYSLVKVDEIFSATAAELLDSLTKESGFKVEIKLHGRNHIYVNVYRDVGHYSSFRTTMDKLANEVEKKIARLKRVTLKSR